MNAKRSGYEDEDDLRYNPRTSATSAIHSSASTEWGQLPHRATETRDNSHHDSRDLKSASITYRRPPAQSLASRFLNSHRDEATLQSTQAAANKAARIATATSATTNVKNASSVASSSSSASNASIPEQDFRLPPGFATFKEYVDTYRVPRADMCFHHQTQLEGSPSDVAKLVRIFDILVRKIHLGSVQVLVDLTTNAQWRALLHVFECVCIILFIQFHHLDRARIETYTRLTVWVESQLHIRETFAIEEMEFCSGTYDCLQTHLNEFMTVDPDAQLLDTVNKSVYLHRMPSGIPFAFFQKNPFQTTKRNPVSILNEELMEHELRYMNDFLLHAKPKDMFENRTHPFHEMFVFVLFACNLKWSKNMYDWMGECTVFNFYFFQRLAHIKRSVNENGIEKRPDIMWLLGGPCVISMWRRDLPTDKDMIFCPTIYQCKGSRELILTYWWQVLYHYDGQLEDGYGIGRYCYDFFKFEANHHLLSTYVSVFGDDADNDDGDDDAGGDREVENDEYKDSEVSGENVAQRAAPAVQPTMIRSFRELLVRQPSHVTTNSDPNVA